MAIKLAQKLSARPLTRFNFTSFEKKVTSNKEGGRVVYFLLELETPIEKVTGSNSLFDPSDGNRRVQLFQVDVISVNVGLDIIEKFESEFSFKVVDDTLPEDEQELEGSGSYKGDLMLDVAKSGDVWLTDIKFSKMAGDFRQGKKSEALTALLAKAEEFANRKK